MTKEFAGQLAKARAKRLRIVFNVIELWGGYYEALTAKEIRRQSWRGITRRDAVARFTPTTI